MEGRQQTVTTVGGKRQEKRKVVFADTHLPDHGFIISYFSVRKDHKI